MATKNGKQGHELPHELIIEEILWRLPVKSLLQFKSVCKPWRFSISSPNFSKLRLRKTFHSIKHERILLNSGPIWSLDHEGSRERLNIINTKRTYPSCIVWGSCNGLLCVTPEDGVISLWNPSTRKYKKLPGLPPEFSNNALGGTRVLAYGLGYDRSTDDYKVLSFIPTCNRTTLYSLRANSWKSIQDFPFRVHHIHPLGSFFNGSLHWTVSLLDDTLPLAILSFNLKMEKFELLSLPKTNVPFPSYIGVLGEHLCLCFPCDDGNHEVWIMKEYGVEDSWARFSTVTRLNGYVPRFYTKMYLPFKSGEVIVLLTDKNEVILYSSKSPTLRNFLIPNMIEAVTYMESLISPD